MINLERLRRAGIEVVGDTSFRDKNCPKEDAEGATLFAEWNRDPQLSKIPFIHIPNEKKRRTGADFKELKEQKMKGAFQAGASDYIALGFPSLVIELKRVDVTLSSIEQDQIDFLVKAQNADAWVCVALGYKAALKFAREWYRKNYLQS